MPIGERIAETLIPMPDAASGWLEDGAPLDSGSAMIAHSNLSHLSERNVRLIGHAPLVGDVDELSTFTDPWNAAYGETFDAAAAAADPYQWIPWVRPDCAWSFGPIALSATRLGTSPPGLYPRKIRVVVQGFVGTASPGLNIYAVLTSGSGTPLHAPRISQATETRVVTGAWTFDLTLDCDVPVRPSETWTSRPDGDVAAASVALAAGGLWVGWYSEDFTTVDRVESVSVFEVY